MPGYIITRPYIPDTTFGGVKESAGEAQISEVVAVGKEFTDDHGNKRTTDVKVGDIILNSYTQHDFISGEYGKYRAVHFSQIIGIKK